MTPKSNRWSGSELGNVWIMSIFNFSRGDLSLWCFLFLRVRKDSLVLRGALRLVKYTLWNLLLYFPTTVHFWQPCLLLKLTQPIKENEIHHQCVYDHQIKSIRSCYEMHGYCIQSDRIIHEPFMRALAGVSQMIRPKRISIWWPFTNIPVSRICSISATNWSMYSSNIGLDSPCHMPIIIGDNLGSSILEISFANKWTVMKCVHFSQFNYRLCSKEWAKIACSKIWRSEARRN